MIPLFEWLYKRRKKVTLPPIVIFERLPKLTVAVFGSLNSFEGSQYIEESFCRYIRMYFPDKIYESIITKSPSGLTLEEEQAYFRRVDEWYKDKLKQKYQLIYLYDKEREYLKYVDDKYKDKPRQKYLFMYTYDSERLSILARAMYKISGRVVLFIDDGAKITKQDADRIINVLSEFSRKPRLMLLQGKGYHAFLRGSALSEYEFGRKGKLSEHCKRWRFHRKRVDYITIDPRSDSDYMF